MKFYIAASFSKKDDVRKLYEELKLLGHTVSYDWTVHKNAKPYIDNQKISRTYSENELKGISECDIFIFLADNGHTLLMEFGAALMAKEKTGKPKIYAIGEMNKDSPWFFNKSVRRFDTIEEAIKDIKNSHTSSYK